MNTDAEIVTNRLLYLDAVRKAKDDRARRARGLARPVKFAGNVKAEVDRLDREISALNTAIDHEEVGIACLRETHNAQARQTGVVKLREPGARSLAVLSAIERRTSEQITEATERLTRLVSERSQAQLSRRALLSGEV
jgi:hypothetical protein